MRNRRIIAPALAALRGQGFAVTGPHPADALFHARARAHYDAAIAMYHDQALIPLKTLAFDEGVNVTLGLPFIRTSPDHGTAFDIAGTGNARADSLIASLRLAARMAESERTPPQRSRMTERTPTSLPPLREVIRELGLSAKKSLGQNFILDLNLTGRIARSAGPLEGMTVAEIGPGPGGLTRALLAEGAARVIAVEKDVRCLPALAAIAAHYPDRLTVIEGDALDVDWPSLLPAGQKARIVANLPYSVATPLLIGWLKTEPWPPWWDRMVLMFQREVAERIVAQPGTKSYGRLAVLSQWRAETRILFHLPPRAFTPPPKVESSRRRVPRQRAAPLDAGGAAMLERVTAAAFGQRRKMLRASLKGLSNAVPLLEELGIERPRARRTAQRRRFLPPLRPYRRSFGRGPARDGAAPDVSDDNSRRGSSATMA